MVQAVWSGYGDVRKFQFIDHDGNVQFGGTYSIRLSVYDGSLTTTKDITVVLGTSVSGSTPVVYAFGVSVSVGS